MSASVQSLLQPPLAPQLQPLAPPLARSVYLDAYLAPLRPWLDCESVTEILVNRPGELWIEDALQPGMQRIELPAMDDVLLQRLAEQVARVSHQGVNREHPLLSATLPAEMGLGGARIQIVGPPATRAHWALAIRRHRLLDLPLDSYDRGPIVPEPQAPLPDARAEPIAYLRHAIRARRTILISGGTSTGKTTFLNAMLREIPPHERVVLVEDTAELRLPGANGVGLIAVKGELGEARKFQRQRTAPGSAAPATLIALCWANCAAPRPSASCAQSTPAIPVHSRPSTPIPRKAHSNRSRS